MPPRLLCSKIDGRMEIRAYFSAQEPSASGDSKCTLQRVSPCIIALYARERKAMCHQPSGPRDTIGGR
jgi:hypothetical protein